jgi:hypothetical protein
MKRILLLLSVLALASCGHRVKPVHSEPVTVRVATIEAETTHVQASYVGKAEAAGTTTVTAPYAGTLVDIPVKQGQSVKKGQVLSRVYSEQVKAAFELRCMSLAGFEPLLDGCAVCGQTPEQPRLNLTQGVLHCQHCGQQAGEGISMPLAPQVLSAMEHIVSCPGKKLLSFRLDEAGLRQLGQVCEAYLLTQMERGYRTLDYYKQLQAPLAAFAKQ